MNRNAILFAQSLYYVVTGASPLISMRFFEFVTGPKVDDWLVRMVGLLAVAIGVTLFQAVRAQEITRAILILAATSALSFAVIDIYYSLTGRISYIYLLDAPLEILFVFNSLYLLKSKTKLS